MATQAKTEAVHRGSCLCGACAIEARGETLFSAFCHCIMCQTLSGAPAVHFTGFTTENLQCVKGEDNLAAYKSSEFMTRFSCKTCSGPVFNESHLPEYPFRDVPVGILARDENGKTIGLDGPLAPQYHIYYKSHVRPMDDGLTKFYELPHTAVLDKNGNKIAEGSMDCKPEAEATEAPEAPTAEN